MEASSRSRMKIKEEPRSTTMVLCDQNGHWSTAEAAAPYNRFPLPYDRLYPSSAYRQAPPKRKRGRPRKNETWENRYATNGVPVPATPYDALAPRYIKPPPCLEWEDQQPHPDVKEACSAPPLKRPRGRPRKNPPTDPKISPSAPVAGFQAPKRPRGRPKGSLNKKKNEDALHGRPCNGFADRDDEPWSPHFNRALSFDVLQVMPGEDVTAVVTSFCQKVQRSICILSASGSVNYVEVKGEAPNGATVHQGEFEIIALSGYFILLGSEDRSWSSRLNIAMTKKEGKLVAGRVCGCIVATSKVQVVLGVYGCPRACAHCHQ